MEIAYPNVAERLFGRPHAIEPVALRAIMDGPLARRVLTGEKLEARKRAKGGRNIKKDRLAAIIGAEQIRSEDGIIDYAITADGIAIIPIAGVLSRRFDWLAAACGWSTYEGLSATLDRVMSDQHAKAVLLDIDSPGGEADGMLDIADEILSARGQGKPIWGVANTLAASAAYALGGSAEKLYLPRLAIVGSIGCVTVHVDQSRLDNAEGLAYTAIYSGARKIDGWAHAPLSDEAKAATQEGVDYVRAQFASLVARQGRLSLADAMATEAGVYTDRQAVDAKLADGVMTFTDALALLTAKVSSNSQGAFKMRNATSAGVTVSETEVQAATASTETTSFAELLCAPVEATVDAAVSADMAPPAPGEKCQLCGQMYPDGDAASAATVAVEPEQAVYGATEIEATLELCAIAGLKADAARKFISAKTSVDKVRADLLVQRANASDALEVNTVDPSAIDATKSEARMKSWRETQQKVFREMGIIRDAK